MLRSPDAGLLSKISEEIARVMRDDGQYVHLDTLQDYVNPITANLTVNSAQSGTLEVMLKAYDQTPYTHEGWFTPPGFMTQVRPGLNAYGLVSSCQTSSGTYHVRAVLKDTDGQVVGRSDLHYVIVNTEALCEAG
jgi:hypothetical protein